MRSRGPAATADPRHRICNRSFYSMTLALLLASGCSRGSGGAGPVPAQPITGNNTLERVEFGRAVDVYGLRNGEVTPFRQDVVIGLDIADERPTGSAIEDSEILYDFFGVDPATFQERLLIPRPLGSTAFDEAFAALDDRLRLVSPGVFSQDTSSLPFSVVPRNAALLLTFVEPLPIDEEFFYDASAGAGEPLGTKNLEAVQLLEIGGVPGEPGALRPIPIRVAVQGRSMVVDPVFLGDEGRRFGLTNNATGMPAAPDQSGANVRLAIALEGPLAIPGLREDRVGSAGTGPNVEGTRSIVRDFRSGQQNDESADISRGFVRDPVRPRIVGQMPMLLAAVEAQTGARLDITVFKDRIEHEIDAGDVLLLADPISDQVIASAEILADPTDDQGQPGVPWVTVQTRFDSELLAADPRTLPGYPSNGTQAQVEEFLRANAPTIVLSAEFTASRTEPVSGLTVRDDPRNFVTFTPGPIADANGDRGGPAEFVSPFAAAVVRFTKPIDLATVRPYDSLFLATRNLFDESATAQFMAQRGIDPAQFNEAKYRTPHLIQVRVFDEGSQTAIRLQTPAGLYLDDAMRNAPGTFDYFVHLLADDGGILDLAGNPIDLQSEEASLGSRVAFRFGVDTRRTAAGRPFFEDNIVANMVRRLEDPDEDPGPSYYIPLEADRSLAGAGGAGPGFESRSRPSNDLFGAFFYSHGGLVARPPSRISRIADNLNQQPVADQASDLRWCPQVRNGPLGPEEFVASNSANTLFGQGIQNPHNPYGSRLQTVWRELDLTLSRVDPDDFNLDVEQMYWAPFTGSEIIFDEFDQVSLFLGHSEFRPEPCVGAFTASPEIPNSGLRTAFEDNFVFNPTVDGTGVESQPDPHAAYVDQPLVIDANLAQLEPNGINRYLPLPQFQEPYFVYRDETVMEQGADSGESADVVNGQEDWDPYIVSPFMGGKGYVFDRVGGQDIVQNTVWDNRDNFALADGPWTNPARDQPDSATGGLVGTIALPLLGDFWTYCDRPGEPAGAGYVALGVNGWQVALTVSSGPQPNFRVYSGGRPSVNGSPSVCIEPGTNGWTQARGGFDLAGNTTRSGDNTFYLTWCDFVKRQTVVTSGFVPIRDPHRVVDPLPGAGPATLNSDPRLGPFGVRNDGSPDPSLVPRFIATTMDPLGGALAAGTSVSVEFRGAGPVDPQPWRYTEQNINDPTPWPQFDPYSPPDAANFPMDPRKAGDAHVRKLDLRSGPSGRERRFWTYQYNRMVTAYDPDPNNLLDRAWLDPFIGPDDVFEVEDLTYFNWRFLMIGNPDRGTSPALDSFAMTWRFRPR